MVGNYIATSFLSSLAETVFAVATVPINGLFNKFTTTPDGLPATDGAVRGIAALVSTSFDYSLASPATAN
jgi:hypothetical protein